MNSINLQSKYTVTSSVKFKLNSLSNRLVIEEKVKANLSCDFKKRAASETVEM